MSFSLNFVHLKLFLPLLKAMKAQKCSNQKALLSLKFEKMLIYVQQIKYSMKNFAILILAALLVLAHGAESDFLPGVGTANPTQLSYNGQIITTTKCVDYTLSAGNTFMDYGTVRVCNSQYNLYIGVYADQGFIGVDAVKIWVGTSLLLLPLPKKGSRPIAGKFDFKSPEFTEITYYWSIQIPFASIKKLDLDPVPTCAGSTIYVYVHVDALDGNTAWGGSQCVGSGTLSAWYCSITYVTKCPQLTTGDPDCTQAVKPPECPTYTCETAYAKGNYILTDTNNPDNLPIVDPTAAKRWGWAYKSDSSYSHITYDIYAGAAQNNITKGYLVGSVAYTWDPAVGTGTAEVSILSNYRVSQFHIHINDTLPESVVAPGQYIGCLVSYPTQTQISVYTWVVNSIVDLLSDGIWFITHVDVCKQV